METETMSSLGIWADFTEKLYGVNPPAIRNQFLCKEVWATLKGAIARMIYLYACDSLGFP